MAETVAGITLPEGDPGAVSDAAAGLRRVSGGFGHTGGVANRAASSVPSWSGLASMTFKTRCGNYLDAANAAETACDQAAVAINHYAQRLEEGREKVEKWQRKGEDCLERIKTAESQAATAADREMFAHHMAYQASFGPDAGATAAEFRSQAEAARDERVAFEGKAQEARDELDRLRELAEAERERVKDAGRKAAREVEAAAGGLPAVDRSAYGSPNPTVRSEGSSGSYSIGAFFVRFGESGSALIEQRADGTYAITTAEGLELGLAGSLGGKVSFGSGRSGPVVGRDISGAALAQLEKGRTYIYPNREAAQDFIDDLEGEDDGGGSMFPLAVIMPPFFGKGERDEDRDPTETFMEGGAKIGVGAAFDRGGGGVSGEVEASSAIGRKINHETGETTHYYKTTASDSIKLSALTAGASRGHESESVMAATYDSDGDLTRISIDSSSATNGSLSFDGDVKDLASLSKHLEKTSVGLESSEGQRYEFQAQLDLNEPDGRDREIAQRFLDSGGTDPQATQDLLDQLDREGQLDVRVYSTSEDSAGIDVEARGFGAEVKSSETQTRLVEAYTRPPGDLRFHELRVP